MHQEQFQMTTFNDHFETHVASAFARQLALADVIGDRSWDLDLDDGQIKFGDDLSFPVQVLGSHSFSDDTWLWAWANTAADLPEPVLQASKALRAAGERLGLRELTESKFAFGPITDHMLAMLCSGLSAGTAYFRAPYGQGAAFVLLSGLPQQLFAPAAGPRAISVITDVISQFEVHHRKMVEAFLDQQGFQTTQSDGSLTATRPDGANIEMSFDDAGRIKEVTGTVRPQEAKAPWWKLW
jgi:hypothetical protein